MQELLFFGLDTGKRGIESWGEYITTNDTTGWRGLGGIHHLPTAVFEHDPDGCVGIRLLRLPRHIIVRLQSPQGLSIPVAATDSRDAKRSWLAGIHAT